MIYNSNEDKFQSIAIGLRNNMNIVLETKLNEASVIEFVKPDLANKANAWKNSKFLSDFLYYNMQQAL